MRATLTGWCQRHLLLTATLLVAACAALGYGAAAVASGKLHEALVIASTTLVFGAFLGGVVKLLLDDLQRARDRRDDDLQRARDRRDDELRMGQQQRDDQARFVTTVLADLKSVYDRVERVRILIAAHESARTYGQEMRDLIDSAVQLRNVIRTLDQATTAPLKEDLLTLKLVVVSMERYLKSLTDEFQRSYKPIADKQRIYEEHFNRLLRDSDPRRDWSGLEPPRNRAWESIDKLPRLAEFRGAVAGDADGDYGRDFEGALGVATWVLRAALRQLAGLPKLPMPDKHKQMYDSIAAVRKGQASTAATVSEGY